VTFLEAQLAKFANCKTIGRDFSAGAISSAHPETTRQAGTPSTRDLHLLGDGSIAPRKRCARSENLGYSGRDFEVGGNDDDITVVCVRIGGLLGPGRL
jgi:hypothetical protein